MYCWGYTDDFTPAVALMAPRYLGLQTKAGAMNGTNSDYLLIFLPTNRLQLTKWVGVRNKNLKLVRARVSVSLNVQRIGRRTFGEC